jgi:hypothetical protein
MDTNFKAKWYGLDHHTIQPAPSSPPQPCYKPCEVDLHKVHPIMALGLYVLFFNDKIFIVGAKKGNKFMRTIKTLAQVKRKSKLVRVDRLLVNRGVGSRADTFSSCKAKRVAVLMSQPPETAHSVVPFTSMTLKSLFLSNKDENNILLCSKSLTVHLTVSPYTSLCSLLTANSHRSSRSTATYYSTINQRVFIDHER